MKLHLFATCLKNNDLFKMKLHLFATCLKNNDLSHFDSLHELLADDIEVECSRFVEDIEALSHEF